MREPLLPRALGNAAAATLPTISRSMSATTSALTRYPLRRSRGLQRLLGIPACSRWNCYDSDAAIVRDNAGRLPGMGPGITGRGDAATMTTSAFKGNILAGNTTDGSITLTGGSIAGRALASVALTITGATVTGCDALAGGCELPHSP
jgi:hypothetical protein